MLEGRRKERKENEKMRKITIKHDRNILISARVFEVFLIVLDGPGGTLWGESRARNNTASEAKGKRGRLGVWLYSPHARVARGEEHQ